MSKAPETDTVTPYNPQFINMQEFNLPKSCLAVPTSTIIGYHPQDPALVCVLVHAAKHQGRMTMPGGKCTGGKTHRECALEEFDQEVGGLGASLLNLRLLAIKYDLLADVRKTTLGRATDYLCPQAEAEEEVTALYGCPDHIFVAEVQGEPSPKDGEAKSTLWFDVRTLVIAPNSAESAFAAEHDLILHLYRKSLEGRPVSNTDMLDMRKLRSSILQGFAK